MDKYNLKISKKQEKQAGITLVALVITVVVMLILAGVAIAAVVDCDGLFSKTRQAIEVYNESAEQEEKLLKELTNRIDIYLDGNVSKLPIASVVEVGDFVNYDAGTWTEEDFIKITNSIGNPTVNKSTNLPTIQGEFGGFTVGESKNTNSTSFSLDSKVWTPDYSGWRVWDIDKDTGKVTLISAGHTETYYHQSEQSEASILILRNRDCSMYENEFAETKSAHILTGQEAVTWYNEQFGTDYTIVDNGEYNSTFYDATFTMEEPIDVLENGSYYWLASPYNSSGLYRVDPAYREVYSVSSRAYGIRVLVTLKSDVQVEQGSATEGITTWNIVEN